MRKTLWCVFVGVMAFEISVFSATDQIVGSYAGWASVPWQALPGLDDPDPNEAPSGGAAFDFVGDSTDRGAYWARDNDHVYFRMRLNAEITQITDFDGAFHLLIDAIGVGNEDGRPDYGFVLDGINIANKSTHGLEMMLYNTASGSSWGTTQMDDWDGNDGTKKTKDINGDDRTDDGYMQYVTTSSTTAFGTTTFLDFAVSFSYLQAYVPELRTHPSWRIQLASAYTENDHADFSSDIGGGELLSEDVVGSAWSYYINTDTGTTSSGVDVRAYQTAEGMMVEFVAYDVEADGTIRLALMGANGEVVWEGSVDVTEGPRSFARFTVPGLELGESYNFQVRDEVGKWWEANGVTVESFATKMTSASLAGITLSFDTLADHDYEIQWVPALGSEWQAITNVTAAGAQTSVVVPHPDPEGQSGFFRIQMK